MRSRVVAAAAGTITLTALTLPAGAAGAAPVLLSQGKNVTASSTENPDYLPATFAADGDTHTRWASRATDDQWLQVDLGAVYDLARVDLSWESAFATGYQIQASTDGTTWTPIYTQANGKGGNESVAVSGTARYVRMQGTARATGYGYSLWEFQVFGSPASNPATSAACDTTTDVAQGRPATASSSEGGNYASLASDDKSDTRWSSTWSDGQWWQVDLGSSKQVCRVVLAWEGAYGKAFQVQTSDSPDSGFRTLATVTNSAGGDQTLTTDGAGRYLRLNLQTRGTGYGFSLWEVKVNAAGSVGQAPAPTLTPPPTTAPTPSGSVPTGPADGKVRVAGSQGNWALLVNGQPFTVKGLTWGPPPSEFPAHAANLKELGVNTIRTWGTDAGSKVLFDNAQAAGIKVMAGFWLAPGGGPGSGGCPNYATDTTYKSDRMNEIVNGVTMFKDNPAVLMWNVGNESILGLTNCYSGTELDRQRTAYATFVNDAAKRIHQIDPNHPVTNTDAWTGAWKYLFKYAPDLDLWGLNSYGAICDTKATWIAEGYNKPYVVTEGGPAGEWEVKDDINGIPDQGTDQDNANGYTNAWNCIKNHPGVALGATLFHYGNEGDFGGIWFNIKPGSNKRLSYYAVARAFGGPAANGTNTPPTFAGMTIANSTNVVAGAPVSVTASATDPDGDAIKYSTFVNSKYIDNAGGLAEVPFTRNGSTFTFTAPKVLGVWKAYIFAEDGKGNVGVETRSFRVSPPPVNGTNIAKGRPTTASSFDPYNGNYTPGQAVDGDLATRWSSNWNDDEWIEVDLGSKRTISTVQLSWESAYAKGYVIQQSDDGTTWSPLATVTNGDGSVDTLDVNGNARYVRLQCTARGTGYGYSLYEFGIYS